MSRPVSTTTTDTLRAVLIVGTTLFGLWFIPVFGWESLIQASKNLTAMNEALGRAP